MHSILNKKLIISQKMNEFSTKTYVFFVFIFLQCKIKSVGKSMKNNEFYNIFLHNIPINKHVLNFIKNAKKIFFTFSQ